MMRAGIVVQTRRVAEEKRGHGCGFSITPRRLASFALVGRGLARAGVTYQSRGIAYAGGGFRLTFPGIETFFTVPTSRDVLADAARYFSGICV
jgi:hypothetical protein